MKILKIIIVLLLSGIAHTTFAQFSVEGTLFDRSNNPVISASITLLKSQDSAVISNTISDINGKYKFENIQANNYIIKVSNVGYADVYKSVEIASSTKVDPIRMRNKVSELQSVEIVEQIAPVVMKNDTAEYNAAAFKVNPDATTEDLVSKMPGVVIQNGKIQAQGEEVKKVIVDGKPFFGDDPSAALKNLPAEVVDKIQIYDAKSDQSQFTGFDDGNTTKTLNVITKSNYRNGAFGRLFAGGGVGGFDSKLETEGKWKAGGIVNIFQGKRRISLMVNSNNINEQNFSVDDIMGMMGSTGGGGGGRSMFVRMGGDGNMRLAGGMGGGDMRNFMVNQQDGLNTTHSFGVNFNDSWKKVELTGSYFYNYSDNSSITETFRQYITNPNQGLTYSELSKSDNVNQNHRLNFRIEYNIDSMNSITFQPRITFQTNDGTSSLIGVNRNITDTVGRTINDNSSNNSGYNWSVPIFYRHSFVKRGRTFSISMTPGYNASSGDGTLYSFTQYTSPGTSAVPRDQQYKSEKEGLNLSGNISYTEPLAKYASLLVNYGTNYNKNNSDKHTYNADTLSEGERIYNILDTAYSNVFENDYFTNYAGAGLRLYGEKWSFTPNINYQVANLFNDRTFPYTYDMKKTFYSVLPSAEFQYRFSTRKNIRINYRLSNNAPSINQLQDVVDNSNPLQLSTGNSHLEQTSQHTLSLRFSNAQMEKMTNFFVSLSGTYTQDYIGSSVYMANNDTTMQGIFLQRGTQLSMPVNLDNYYNVRMFANYGLPIKALKTNFNVNVSGGYSQTPSLINYQTNYANNTSAGIGIVLSSNISEKVDFMISSNSTMNFAENTLQTDLNSEYLNQMLRARLNLMPWKGFTLQTEATYQYYSTFADNYKSDYFLWNASLGYKFGSKRNLELRLTAYDLLNSNKTFNRSITETYYQDTRTNALSRYYLLTLSYNFRQFKTKNADVML